MQIGIYWRRKKQLQRYGCYLLLSLSFSLSSPLESFTAPFPLAFAQCFVRITDSLIIMYKRNCSQGLVRSKLALIRRPVKEKRTYFLVHLRGESILWREKQLKMSFRQDFCTDDLRGDQRWSPRHHKDHRQFRRLVIARSKKNRESDISQKVFELVKLNNEFENCLNPAKANKFVILNRYELKFLHSANTG